MAATVLTTTLAAGLVAFAGHFGFDPPTGVELVSADCNAAAQRVVAKTGGQLLSVAAVHQGSRTVCRVTVLVPSSDHKRPRKMTVTVGG